MLRRVGEIVDVGEGVVCVSGHHSKVHSEGRTSSLLFLTVCPVSGVVLTTIIAAL